MLSTTRMATLSGGRFPSGARPRGRLRSLPRPSLPTRAPWVSGLCSTIRRALSATTRFAAWHYVPSYFSSHVWSFLYPHLLSNYYRPFFLLWLRLNDALFGLHPWGWHLTSVLAHLGVTCLVYCWRLRLTRDTWVAGFAGLIFGLHPVHIEAVAYVSAVPEAALHSVCAGGDAGLAACPRGRIWTHWLAAALALLSRRCFQRKWHDAAHLHCRLRLDPRGGGRAGNPAVGKRLRVVLVAAAPFLAVTLVYVPLRVWALKGFAHTVTPVDLRTELLTIPAVLIFYLRLLVWPLGLSCYYDTPYISAATLRGFFLPLVGVLAAAGLAARVVFPDAPRSACGSARLGVCRPLDGARDFAGSQLPPVARRRNRPRPLPLPPVRGLFPFGGARAAAVDSVVAVTFRRGLPGWLGARWWLAC